MAEQIEYYGVFLAAQICRTHNNNHVMRLGEPDAIMRRGVKDLGLWRCERVLDYASSGKLWEAPASPPTYYQGTKESARFVGISERALQRILAGKEPQAYLIPDQRSEPHALWSEEFLHSIRRAIGAGQIEVRARALTKQKYGVRLCSPRHVMAEDQDQEAHRLAKVITSSNPFASVVW